MASLTAPAANGAQRSPLHVTAVVDVSGSMRGAKMQMMQRTLSFLVSKGLSSADSFGLVTFDHADRTVLELTPMDAEGKRNAQKRIDALRTGGQTNLSGGLLRGIKMQRHAVEVAEAARPRLSSLQALAAGALGAEGQELHAIPEEVAMGINAHLPPTATRAVLLFTDGQANIGITDPEGILEAAQAAISSCGCNVFTFGFGSDHNDALLRTLAGRTNGLYYFVQASEDIPNAFADCLGGLVSVASRDVMLTIRSQEGASLGRALCAYTVTLLEGGGIVINMGDLYAEEQKDVLIELTLPQLPDAANGCAPLEVSLRHFCMLTGAHVEERAVLHLERPTAEPTDAQPNLRLDEQRNRVLVADAMAQASALADAGRIEEGRHVLAAELSRAKTTISAQMRSETVDALMDDLVDVAEGYGDEATYFARGAKHCKMTLASHQLQRSNHSSAQQYSSSSKQRMKSWFGSA